MSGVTFQPHSQYSMDVARAWRTDDVSQDRLKCAEEQIGQEPSHRIITPDDKVRTFEVRSGSSSSSSPSSSSSESNNDVLALILSKMDAMGTKIDTMSARIQRMERRIVIQDKQIASLVDMSCPDKLLSMVLCGYSKTIRDSNLTKEEREFLAQSQKPEVEDGTR